MDYLHGLKVDLPESEVKAIKTISKFARDCNCTLYFVHIGSTDALNQIQEEEK